VANQENIAKPVSDVVPLEYVKSRRQAGGGSWFSDLNLSAASISLLLREGPASGTVVAIHEEASVAGWVIVDGRVAPLLAMTGEARGVIPIGSRIFIRGLPRSAAPPSQ